MPKFIVQFQGQESTAELKPGANSIGRQSTCTIPLKDSTLSRLHCEVILAGTVATLLDKGSRNGTLLNGKKIEAQVLQPGDKIQIGATTLWYEKKNVAAEAPKAATSPALAAQPAPSTRRAAAPAAPQTDSGLRKAPTAAVRPSTPSVPADPQLQDFSFHGKAGGNGGKIVAAVLALAVLGGAGFGVKKFLDRPAAVVEDTENLVVRNAHFDVVVHGKPDAWVVRPGLSGEKPSCSASVDPARGRNGGPALLLDKSGGAADLVGECYFQDDLVAKNASVAASAWTQFDNFNGWAALKVDWLKSPKGAVLSEEYSDPVKATAWTEIKATFHPPPGAGAFRFALAVVGRSGRVFFDDVSVKTQPGAPAAPEKKIGDAHKVSYSRAGILQIDLKGGRRTISNIGLRLESDKEGLSPQAFSTEVAATPDESGVGFEGRMINPLDFREIVFRERVGQTDGLTNVEYGFRGDALKQVDRVTIAFTLPRVDGPPRGIPENGDPTTRIICSAEDGEFAFEYQDPAVVKFKTVDGRIRVTQTWRVDPQAEDPTFVFRIRDAGGLKGGDWQTLVNEATGQRKLGEALTILRDNVKKIKDAAVREKVESDVKRLEEAERSAWAEVQALVFQARISRRPELVTKATDALNVYLKEWAGEGTEGKAEALRRDLDKELASTPAGEAERPRRIFERAKKYIEGGKRAIAQSMLQTLVTRYPSSDVTPQAQSLLKTLSE